MEEENQINHCSLRTGDLTEKMCNQRKHDSCLQRIIELFSINDNNYNVDCTEGCERFENVVLYQ